jgi:hypothetical protein
MKQFLNILIQNQDILECFERVYIQQWVCIDVLGETPTGHLVPYIGDLSILTAYDYAKIEKEALVKTAITRGDHELFLLTEKEFRDQVLNNTISYPEINVSATIRRIDDIVLELIFHYDIFIKDYHQNLRFFPVKGVW